jgi:DNA-binding transcriptional ArsR family regulator
MTARVSEDETPDPRRLIALLADPARLRVYAALVLASTGDGGGAQPAELAATSGVPLRDVLRTLSRLEDAGLAAPESPQDTEGTEGTECAEATAGWRATPETLRAAGEATARQRDDAALPGPPVQDPTTAAVLRGFFSRGRLTHVPLAHAKRMVVLDYLAQSFEPGVRYPEAEVNEILGKFHDDYAALRRYLVDADFLGRSESYYWRTGGSFGL